MKQDEFGFLYPSISSASCVECSLCERACPVLSEVEPKKEEKPVFAAKIKNKSKLASSSSGGVFTFLAEKVLAQNGVVCAARFESPTHLIHDFCTNIDELDSYKGSKYFQSDLGNCFKKIKQYLSEERMLLFVGTPCQIMGLKLYLRKEYERLITLEIVCHGVPSLLAWRKYISELSNQKNTELSQIDKIEFRNKDKSWREYNLKISANGKTIHKKSLRKDLYLKAFLKSLMLRESCHACPANNFRADSDLLVGDYWGVDNFHEEIDDDRGISCMIFNNKSLLSWFESGEIELYPTKYEYVFRANKAIEISSKPAPERERYMNALLNNNFIETTKPYVKTPLSLRLKYEINSAKKLLKKLFSILKK